MIRLPRMRYRKHPYICDITGAHSPFARWDESIVINDKVYISLHLVAHKNWKVITLPIHLINNDDNHITNTHIWYNPTYHVPVILIRIGIGFATILCTSWNYWTKIVTKWAIYCCYFFLHIGDSISYMYIQSNQHVFVTKHGYRLSCNRHTLNYTQQIYNKTCNVKYDPYDHNGMGYILKCKTACSTLHKFVANCNKNAASINIMPWYRYLTHI